MQPAPDPLATADVEPGALALLQAARAGRPAERRLRIAALRPGDVGVLEATVTQCGTTRPYRRRRGGEGLLCRVTLEDGTGEVDLVLWDDEVRLTADVFTPGARLLLRGPAVRPGHRGGVELSVGAAVIEPAPTPAHPPLAGVLRSVGHTRIVGEPPAERFTAEAELETATGVARVALWDRAVRDARAVLPGAPVEVAGVRPHPHLEGWWIADEGARLRPKP